MLPYRMLKQVVGQEKLCFQVVNLYPVHICLIQLPIFLLLASGAKSLGYPGVSHGLFPRGGIELVHHFYRTSNEKLITDLEKKTSDQDHKQSR